MSNTLTNLVPSFNGKDFKSYAKKMEEPDVTVIRVLLNNCLPHAAEFGFFLSTSRFELDGFM
ncbi:hypothetical protein EV121DRAFT_295175 [Schizophyllum commune]